MSEVKTETVCCGREEKSDYSLDVSNSADVIKRVGSIARLIVGRILEFAELLPEIIQPIASVDIVAMHEQIVEGMHRIGNEVVLTAGESPLHESIQSNAVSNFRLWHFEDEARRIDLPDSDIATLKRSIDRENQQRSNHIERIDDTFSSQLSSADPSLPFNSETPGSIIDRLAIISLKIYHMNQELLREATSAEHKDSCRLKLQELIDQRKNLATALDLLLKDLFGGRKRLVLYRPHKMYNDPNLNPSLYNQHE